MAPAKILSILDCKILKVIYILECCQEKVEVTKSLIPKLRWNENTAGFKGCVCHIDQDYKPDWNGFTMNSLKQYYKPNKGMR